MCCARASLHVTLLAAHMLTNSRGIGGCLTVFVVAKRAFPRLLARCRWVWIDGDVVAPRLALSRRGQWHGVAIAAGNYGAGSLH